MFSIIVLAAGLGKRMENPDIPKVLAELHGKPIIYYVLSSALELNPDKITVIVGHKRELLIDYIKSDFAGKNIEFIVQEQQSGTGHAVKCAAPAFAGYAGNILILSGDVPLLKSATLEKFITCHDNIDTNISVLSSIAYNPTGYGRIVRNIDGDFAAIIEEKDADESVKKINEINSGIYYLPANLLFDLLPNVNNDNSQNEYYLTDIITIGKLKNQKVVASIGAKFEEIQGINTPEQLRYVEELMNINK